VLPASKLAASPFGAVPPVAPKPDVRGPALAKSRAASEARFADALADEDFALEDEAPATDRESFVPPGAPAHDLHPHDIPARGILAHDAEAFGSPRPRGAAKVPMANLQRPSAPRLDLTPSPVPRVALSPATGSVDISLVPGPYASRNLPTLAAQHALGRRQRRPAPARTLPPPSRGSREARPTRLRDVRSSKREIVLGLTIGLGLSLVLAAIGQNYLRPDPIANAPLQQLESLTLSARPRAPANEMAVAEPSGTGPAPVEPPGAGSALEPARDGRGQGDPTRSAGNFPRADGNAPQVDGNQPLADGATPAFAAPGTFDGRPRADLARHGARTGTANGAGWGPSTGSRPANSHAARSTLVSAPPAPEAGKSPEEAAPARARMSPAESAGLGLDLPL
jgi:hypothetical protein